MRRLFPRLLVLAALLSVAACDEEMISLESGTPSTLDVRVYVDVNGNGTFDGADQAIGSANVTLSGEGVEESATTGDNGVVRFEGVTPGSYTLAISGGAPQGAVLATASTPTVVADFRGGQIEAEFRYAFLPGDISGRLFRDDNENGTFDADEDTPGAGVTVSLASGSGSSGDPVAETTTESDGTFSFEGLRPGSYTLSVDAPPSVTLEAQTLTVAPGAETSTSLVFTGSFLIDIADARASEPGAPVTVEGTVTWAPDFNRDIVFIQDGTAGILLFDGDGLGTFQEGDVLRVTGERDEFFSEVQISGITALEVVSTGSVPDPRLVTAGEINDGRFQGELVSNEGVVESVDVRRFDNQLVTLRDNTGELFTVWVDSRTDVGADTWTVGATFAVTGVLGIDTREDLPFRIEVRFPDDVQAGGSTISVAEARTRDGETVVVQGVVTWATPDDRVIFFQDATGGMSTFDFNLPPLNRGDLVVLQGEVGAFQGEVQLSPVNSVQVLGNVAVPPPAAVTGAELNAGEHQGELVVATGTVKSLDSFNLITLTDGAGTDFAIRWDEDTGVAESDFTVGETIRVTGVVGNDQRNDPAPRIELRGPEDLETMVEAGVVTTAEARALPEGTMVTVQGVVIWQPTRPDGSSFSDELWIQDATGGLQMFARNSDVGELGLQPGDVVRVSGETEDRFGERQLTNTSALSQVGEQDPPTPLTVTPSQIASGQFIHQLVRVQDATVVSVDDTTVGFGNQLVTLLAPNGVEFGVYVDSRTGVTASDWTVGETVDVTGVINFDSRWDPFSLRIWIRGSGDKTAS